MVRRRRPRPSTVFPERLARFRAEEWKEPREQALRTWAQARVAFWKEHGEHELGVDFLEVLQGNVEAKKRVY